MCCVQTWNAFIHGHSQRKKDMKKSVKDIDKKNVIVILKDRIWNVFTGIRKREPLAVGHRIVNHTYKEKVMKIYVVGRHTGDIPENTIVKQENVQFEVRSEDVIAQLKEIKQRAVEAGADALVFQSLPGQAFNAMLKDVSIFDGDMKIGQVVSIPGKREEITEEFSFLFRWKGVTDADISKIIGMVHFVNPNAKVVVQPHTNRFIVTTAAPMTFEFSHIEWFNV